MKKYLYLIFLMLSLSVSAFADTANYVVPARKVESFAFDNTRGLTAFILLSDGSMWKMKCSFSDEMVLNGWKKNDDIVIGLDPKCDGIELHNRRDYSKVYAFPTKESMELFPMIENIEIKKNWFSTNYYIYLNDGSKWEVWGPTDYLFSYRWASGQRVVLSTGFGFNMINLNLQWDPHYIDDRHVYVNES